MMKKLLTVMLALICVMLFAVPAMAEEMDIATSSRTIEGGTYTITQSGTGSTSNTITVKSGVTANITLNGVNISSASNSPFYIESGATVNLTLAAGTTNTLVAEGAQLAGLHVADGATLKIIGDDTGELNATGGYNAPGIGGVGRDCTVAEIAISGGIVNAYGTNNGPGIGAGNYADIKKITISGGIVTATAGNAGNGGRGAGIGLGVSDREEGTQLEISISGGTIIATRGGDSRSADIGGYGPSNSTKYYAEVKITGGNIKTTTNGIDHCKSLTNGTEDVVKHTFIFDGMTERSDITSLSLSDDVNYEVKKDVKTLGVNNNELYAYLPDGTVPIEVKAGGKSYRTYVIGENNTFTFSQTKLTGIKDLATTLNEYHADASSALSDLALPKTVIYTTSTSTVVVDIEWSFTGDYNSDPGETNTFSWKVTEDELSKLNENFDLNGQPTEGSAKIKNTNASNYPAPEFVYPTADVEVTVNVGEKATLKVEVNADYELTYMWLKSIDGGNQYTPTGITTSTYETDPAELANEGYKYRCAVLKRDGTPTTSPVFTLRVRSTGGGVPGDPAPAPTPAPQTGDASNIGLWLALSCISLAGMVAIVMQGKKKRI